MYCFVTLANLWFNDYVRSNNYIKSSSIGMHIVSDNRSNSTKGTRVIIVIYSSPNFGSLFSRNAETPSAKSEVSEELVMSNFSNSS